MKTVTSAEEYAALFKRMMIQGIEMLGMGSQNPPPHTFYRAKQRHKKWMTSPIAPYITLIVKMKGKGCDRNMSSFNVNLT